MKKFFSMLFFNEVAEIFEDMGSCTKMVIFKIDLRQIYNKMTFEISSYLRAGGGSGSLLRPFNQEERLEMYSLTCQLG